MNKTAIYIGTGVGAVVFVFLAVWLFFFRPDTELQTSPEASFGIGDNRSVTVSNQPVSSEEVVDIGQTSVQQTVFKIADGPLAGATLIETTRPTTTLARYVKQENGHVFEVPLGIPGSVPRALSNTTIPGVTSATWVERGSGVILRYLSDQVIKSVYLGFPPATTTAATSTRPTRIQFLPDNITALAASPDGSRVAYLLTTSSGSAGYVAGADGSGSAALFSLPLAQVTLAWPAQGALLLTTKSAAGVPGMAFSVNTTSGLVTPLIHAPGLTATADPSFSRVIYQSVLARAVAPVTYARSVAAGTDAPLSFDPHPEKCIWSRAASSTMYCAAPLQFVPANYLDLWHLGVASVPDSIFAYDITAGQSSVVAIPGSADGGVAADIIELALSPSETYLAYISKVTRELWGVRIESQ